MSGFGKYWFFSFVLALLPYVGVCQQVEEKLIVKDEGDSLMLNAFRTSFDTNGNYYFETLVKGKGNRFSLITNKKKYPTVFWERNIALVPYKAIIANAFFSDSTHRKIYYKNKSGTKIYGPRSGKIREVLEYGKENIAIELCIGSQSYLYVNDSLVNVLDSLHQLWLCAFSDNNNVIYSVYKNGAFRLYLNHKMIDSADEVFTDIAVNNNNYYTYAKKVNGKYFVHTPDKTFGPFGIVEYSDLLNNNTYYYRGCADSQCYVLVNGKLYNNIPEAHTLSEDPTTGSAVYHSDEEMTVELINNDNYLFTYNQNNDEGTFVNINGNTTHHNYSMVSVPVYNKNEGYAFYGSRIDSAGVERTFKNINGVEKRLPPFKKAKYRPHCLYIEPSGASLYYYESRDSIYTFRNDTLFCKPTARQKFLLWDASVLPQVHPEGLEYFQGFNADSTSYIMYNNTLSKPLPYINPKYDRIDPPSKGNIMAGDMNGHGFFIIQYLERGKFLLTVNNKIYKELTGITYIFSDQCYITEHSVVFYGIKGSAFYQFKVSF